MGLTNKKPFTQEQARPELAQGTDLQPQSSNVPLP